MISYRRKQILTLTILLIAVFTLSIGFAAYSTSLKIKPQVSVTPDAASFSVKFSTTKDALTVSAIKPYSLTSGMEATDGVISNSGVPTVSNLSATFTQSGDTVTYRFYVRNEGSYIAYLNSITFNGGKTCTPKGGTTASMVNSACNYMSMTLKVGDTTVTGTTTDIVGETLNPKEGKLVEVTVKYTGSNTITDGDFSIEFGSISLYYVSTPGINEGDEGVTGTLYTGEIYRTSTQSVSIGADIDTFAYETTLSNISQSYYLKHDVVDNKVTASYACITYEEDGVRKDVCLRGGGSSYYAPNQEILRDVGGDCRFGDLESACFPDSLSLRAYSGGYVLAGDDSSDCNVGSGGLSYCYYG